MDRYGRRIQPNTSTNMYVIGGVVLVFVFFMVYILTKQDASVSLVQNGPFSLTSPNSIVSSSNFGSISDANRFLKNGAGTFQCFVYLDTLSRSGGAVGCGQTGGPKCSGFFDPCKCTNTSDCTNCVHVGYNSLVSLYGVYTLEVLTAPDASRPSSVLAQLSVKTTTQTMGTVVNYIETIPLDAIPMQKWTMITIAKEGRRIDVYYNDHFVSSTSLNNMIVGTGDGTIVVAGDIGLSGSIGLVRFDTNRLSVGEVSSVYSQLADTRGAPNTISTNVTGTTASMSANTAPFYMRVLTALCLDGSCLTVPQIHAPVIGQPFTREPEIQPTLGRPSPIYALSTEYA